MQGDLLGLGQPSSDQSAKAPSAGLTLNLASNNPFRNRAASPNSLASPAPGSPFDDPSPRPSSRNPFLDPDFDSSASRTVASPEKMAQSKPTHSATAEEIFGGLTLDDKPRKTSQSGMGSGQPPMNRPPRGENIPPRGRGPPPGTHRPSRSQEEAFRARRRQNGSNGAMPARSPQRSEPRLRRNSESSVMEKPISEEEKKMRDMRRRDRERRDCTDRNGKPKTKKLDIIDQLDATSIYGTGLFHHDGPFDACNPNRNRKGSRRAPMQAFAKDSANNTIGGAGPLNKRPDHTQFLAQEQHEAQSMYAGERRSKKEELSLYDPKRADVEHGEETLGLGSSTFLEGTPAAMTAIVRNQNETAQEAAERDSGLGRKKSVVSRFKSIKRGPREPSDGRVVSPEAYYTPRPSGAPTGYSSAEANPFFAEFDKGGEEQITVRRKDSNARTPLSPPPPPAPIGANLERRSTTDATMDSPVDGQPKQGGGFMSRMRSLKGGRRQQQQTEPAQPAHPGTAM
ncbi:Pal1-domain-containing protein [Xylariaceae sp. FL1272]|nr:Pal1-domain-containing protein [Xylariaceae sp. FL1272]